jgi:hypothetical protein
MLFHRKGRLKREFNEKLLQQLDQVKAEWTNKKKLVERSFDPSGEFIAESKLAEAKYFFLFKEAKERKISIKGR